jgi:hypothetical protein
VCAIPATQEAEIGGLLQYWILRPIKKERKRERERERERVRVPLSLSRALPQRLEDLHL